MPSSLKNLRAQRQWRRRESTRWAPTHQARTVRPPTNPALTAKLSATFRWLLLSPLLPQHFLDAPHGSLPVAIGPSSSGGRRPRPFQRHLLRPPLLAEPVLVL